MIMNVSVEVLGVIASLLIIKALGCKNVNKLRYWNLAGSALYIVYGLLLHSPSIVLLNFVAIFINICKIVELHRTSHPLSESLEVEGKRDFKYGGVVTDINKLSVNTQFYVHNGGWYGTIQKDLMGKYISISGRPEKHRLKNQKPYLLSISYLDEKED